jgi:hypothetical protein
MSQIIPIYIPTYINNADYTPARVLPRLLFYNGLLDCQTYWIESGSLAFGGVTYQQNAFPYFDNYNVVTGSFPTTDSDSLLFNNEGASYGEVPINSLYTTYWEKYIQFLYNPKTRILNCSAIIPLADYFHMELNDIVNFRGNYYHLRAINDYSLKDGTCNLQLLGPVIPDVFDTPAPAPAPTPEASASISWSYTESVQNGSFRIYDNGSNKVTATSTSTGNLFTTQSHIINVELDPVGYPISGSVTMSLFVNGNTTLSTTSNANTTITASFTATGGGSYQITGSIQWNDSACCTPTITSVTASSGNTIDVYFTTGSGCSGCTTTTIQSSLDNSTWGGSNTGGCGSPRTITAPTASTYYRMYETCTSTTSSFSNSVLFTTSSAGTGSATLAWSYSETGGANAFMDIYVNGSAVISRSNTASGNYTVYVGDTISVNVDCNQCTGGDTYANVSCTGIISDSDCVNNGVASIFTANYTVISADAGTTLSLDCFASCDGACV